MKGLVPFPLPIRDPKNEVERLYYLAYLRCMSASWQLAGDPCKDWQGTIYTPVQSFADELVEAAEVFLTLRGEKMKDEVSA